MQDYDVIIIPEQHLWGKNITTIPKMCEDNEVIIDKLYSIIKECENPVIIFDGDIWHQGVRYTSEVLSLLKYPITLDKITNGKVYSVIGNHELTYNKNNIFWSISDVNTSFCSSRVENPLIKSVDELILGDTVFIFGHYNRSLRGYKPSIDDYKHAVLITHNEVLNDELKDALKANQPEFNTTFIKGSIDDFVPKIHDLDYVFVGHMHQAHGKYQFKQDGYDFIIHYLASLGRTNHKEFTPDIKREIPIFRIRNGELTSLDYKEIVLSERYISVDEEQVKLNQEAYNRNKEIRTLRDTKTYNYDTIKGLKDSFNLNPRACGLIDCALENRLPKEIEDLMIKHSSLIK